MNDFLKEQENLILRIKNNAFAIKGQLDPLLPKEFQDIYKDELSLHINRFEEKLKQLAKSQNKDGVISEGKMLEYKRELKSNLLDYYKLTRSIERKAYNISHNKRLDTPEYWENSIELNNSVDKNKLQNLYHMLLSPIKNAEDICFTPSKKSLFRKESIKESDLKEILHCVRKARDSSEKLRVELFNLYGNSPETLAVKSLNVTFREIYNSAKEFVEIKQTSDLSLKNAADLRRDYFIHMVGNANKVISSVSEFCNDNRALKDVDNLRKNEDRASTNLNKLIGSMVKINDVKDRVTGYFNDPLHKIQKGDNFLHGFSIN